MASLMIDEFEKSGVSITPESKTSMTGNIDSLLNTQSSTFEDTDWLKAGKAAAKGLKAGALLMSHFNNIGNIDSQIAAISLGIAENQRRHKLAVNQLRQKADSTVSRQKEAFLSSGVKLEGSAIDVVSDTMYDLLEAEIERNRELGFAEEQQRVQQANLKSQRSNLAVSTMINVGTTMLG